MVQPAEQRQQIQPDAASDVKLALEKLDKLAIENRELHAMSRQKIETEHVKTIDMLHEKMKDAHRETKDHFDSKLFAHEREFDAKLAAMTDTLMCQSNRNFAAIANRIDELEEDLIDARNGMDTRFLSALEDVEEVILKEVKDIGAEL